MLVVNSEKEIDEFYLFWLTMRTRVLPLGRQRCQELGELATRAHTTEEMHLNEQSWVLN